MRTRIYAITMVLMVVAMSLLARAYTTAWEQRPVWDGEWTCNPGSPYTTKECP